MSIKLTIKFIMFFIKFFKVVAFLIISTFFLNSCNGKLPGADARKYSTDPKERVQRNLDEGRGFKLMDSMNKNKSGVFEFATSNELWRASLDVIDFIPLTGSPSINAIFSFSKLLIFLPSLNLLKSQFNANAFACAKRRNPNK